MSDQQQTQPSPEDQARFQKAGEAESAMANEATARYLQERVVVLHAAILERDEKIAALESEVATLRQARDASSDPHAP